jgi:F-type H+-transporting ATPase subunit delta
VRGMIVARSYAAALFELGEKHGVHDDFARGLDTVSELLESDARIRDFLETPKVGLSRKRDALRSALHGRVPPLLLNFVMVVLRKRRQRLLHSIADIYREMLDERSGIIQAQVTLAHEPDDAQRHEIATVLSRITGMQVVPRIKVDRTILGGLIVRYGDHIMDGSLQHRLNTLRRRLIDATLPARG